MADYVLAGYGTGAIMAVPGRTTDWEFADTHGLPIVRTVQPPPDFEGGAWPGEGPAINSDFLNGLDVEAAKAKMIQWLEEQGHGVRKVNYKLSRLAVLAATVLGRTLPHRLRRRRAEDRPPTASCRSAYPNSTATSPAALPKGRWPTCGTGCRPWTPPRANRPAGKRTPCRSWAGSCWYYLRYLDPHNDAEPVAGELERYWMPVDLYVGGAEHAVLHLLYARFWHKVLFDAGVVSTPEPFGKLVHQGMILGELEFSRFQNEGRARVSAEFVRGGRDTRSGRAVQRAPVNEREVANGATTSCCAPTRAFRSMPGRRR